MTSDHDSAIIKLSMPIMKVVDISPFMLYTKFHSFSIFFSSTHSHCMASCHVNYIPTCHILISDKESMSPIFKKRGKTKKLMYKRMESCPQFNNHAVVIARFQKALTTTL